MLLNTPDRRHLTSFWCFIGTFEKNYLLVLGPCFFFMPPKNIRKLDVLKYIQGVQKGNNSLKWVNVKL